MYVDDFSAGIKSSLGSVDASLSNPCFIGDVTTHSAVMTSSESEVLILFSVAVDDSKEEPTSQALASFTSHQDAVLDAFKATTTFHSIEDFTQGPSFLLSSSIGISCSLYEHDVYAPNQSHAILFQKCVLDA